MLHPRPPLARNLLGLYEQAGNIVTPSEGEDSHETATRAKMRGWHPMGSVAPNVQLDWCTNYATPRRD